MVYTTYAKRYGSCFITADHPESYPVGMFIENNSRG